MPTLVKAVRAAVLVALSAALLSITVPAGTAEAASAVQFGTFVNDPSGADRYGDNRQLNRETIVLRNTTNKTVNIGGYRVKDKQGHTYVVPKNFKLGKKASVTLHTGKGKNSSKHLYWNQRNYVWNNTGDTAKLYPAKGSKALDTCSYKKGGTTKC
ncbi:lamin tail domain-containing protein [Propionibacteriaceae bacterium Y1700]|uniref:lamin tail domain-containing protein n=1 Tax=Microlunatus sp. Y1700 TaxID=3418487 RepID=UPI003DA766C8